MATCLADALRPQTVAATCTLVENSTGSPPALPAQQTCCGQILYNAGDRKGAQQQALRVMDLFETFPTVVVPSGSCAGMLACHYPQLLAETQHARRAESFANKVCELSEFLASPSATQQRRKQRPQALRQAPVLAWHDSCSCLRERPKSAACARSLLSERGFSVKEASEREVCCGFGGKFSLANSAVSTSMADDKLRCLQQSGATVVAAADLGCLLHLSGRARRRALPLSFFHIAELLVEENPPSLGA